MNKDPAFLFYSNDFYTGTRMMLPEERACYIDLLVYQHQNGFIPNQLDRVLMFCSGVGKATLVATLKAKFKQCDKGWYNEKLGKIIEERKEYKTHQSQNGTIGAFLKKVKKSFSKKEFDHIKKVLYEDYGKEKFIEIYEKEKEPLRVAKAMLKHLEDENENENEVKSKKRSVFQKPTVEEIKERIEGMSYSVNAEQFFHFYESKGWKVGKNKMKSWESALANWNARNKKETNKTNFKAGRRDVS